MKPTQFPTLLLAVALGLNTYRASAHPSFQLSCPFIEARFAGTQRMLDGPLRFRNIFYPTLPTQTRQTRLSKPHITAARLIQPPPSTGPRAGIRPRSRSLPRTHLPGTRSKPRAKTSPDKIKGTWRRPATALGRYGSACLTRRWHKLCAIQSKDQKNRPFLSFRSRHRHTSRRTTRVTFGSPSLLYTSTQRSTV